MPTYKIFIKLESRFCVSGYGEPALKILPHKYCGGFTTSSKVAVIWYNQYTATFYIIIYMYYNGGYYKATYNILYKIWSDGNH